MALATAEPARGVIRKCRGKGSVPRRRARHAADKAVVSSAAGGCVVCEEPPLDISLQFLFSEIATDYRGAQTATAVCCAASETATVPKVLAGLVGDRVTCYARERKSAAKTKALNNTKLSRASANLSVTSHSHYIISFRDCQASFSSRKADNRKSIGASRSRQDWRAGGG